MSVKDSKKRSAPEPPAADAQFYLRPAPIPSPTKLVSLRTGKLKPLGSLSITSGIIKDPRPGLIKVSKLGLTDDEHDLTFHGGVDKAIHQYCSDHYPLWRDMFKDDDEVSSRFFPGGFGENLVASGFSEKNVCIGDQVRVGRPGTDAVGGESGVLLEVSIPRQPCFKLNQRFGVKAFAGRTHELNRTGWYYRVKEEGSIGEGMEIRVVERRNPLWTIAKVHQHIHRDTENISAMEEAVLIPEMGKESKDVFKKRLEKRKKEQEEGTDGGKKKEPERWFEYKVTKKHNATPTVMSFTLQSVAILPEMEPLTPGCHAHLKLGNGLLRSYSIVGGTSENLEFGVARDANSRGGSTYIHDTLQDGDIISVGKITQSIPKVASASNHIFIAGGIGITAFIKVIQYMKRIAYQVELHYAVRSTEEIAYKEALEIVGAEHLHIYDKSKGQRLDIPKVLKDRKWNSVVYVCGGQRIIDEVQRTAKAQGIDEDEVHYEAFQTDTSGDAFTAEIQGSDKRLDVGEEETLLEAMRKAGFTVDSSCEVGNCGTCKVRVCEGRVEHRGSALSTEEKEEEMLSCVSRGIGHIMIETIDA